ncbi:MAG TPA: hypothetical protein DEB09_02565 [Candidatus Magasanikbacteria bacterium]|nr:hypothetical protein [Candidatus Magasanikbacteria bacterium]
MDLQEWKQKIILEKLGIKQSVHGRIYTFIDFGNLNYWFEKDRKDYDQITLVDDKKIFVDLEKLYDFTKAFSLQSRVYYGVNPKKRSSVAFIQAMRYFFGKRKIFSKPIQQIRHYLEDNEVGGNTRSVNSDRNGEYVFIPKCNFDVEICVDAIRLASEYDTFCLFSSDADFIGLNNFLKKQGKKIILIKGGFALTQLKKTADKVINAQDIKQYITKIDYKKQKI